MLTASLGSIRGCKDATLVTKSTYPFNGADIAHSTYNCVPGDRLLQEYPYQTGNDTLAQNTCDLPCMYGFYASSIL